MLDETDLKILSLLQDNALLPTKEIGERIGLSVTGTYARVKRMEQNGTIKQYVALLDPQKTELELIVFCLVNLVNNYQVTIDLFSKKILDLKEVVSAHCITGESAFILKIMVKDIQMYNQFLVNSLTAIKEIARYESFLSLQMIKDTHKLPLNITDEQI